MLKLATDEHSCGKADRCMYGTDCPYRKHPMPSYLCFEREFKTTGMVKQQRRLENENNRT